jgi:hypothetical protein
MREDPQNRARHGHQLDFPSEFARKPCHEHPHRFGRRARKHPWPAVPIVVRQTASPAAVSGISWYVWIALGSTARGLVGWKRTSMRRCCGVKAWKSVRTSCLVCQYRALSFEHQARDDILGCDQFYAVLLPMKLAAN